MVAQEYYEKFKKYLKLKSSLDNYKKSEMTYLNFLTVNPSVNDKMVSYTTEQLPDFEYDPS